jgi:hypothetical protein
MAREIVCFDLELHQSATPRMRATAATLKFYSEERVTSVYDDVLLG